MLQGACEHVSVMENTNRSTEAATSPSYQDEIRQSNVRVSSSNTGLAVALDCQSSSTTGDEDPEVVTACSDRNVVGSVVVEDSNSNPGICGTGLNHERGC